MYAANHLIKEHSAMAENILIVDDEKPSRIWWRIYLTNEGYHVYKFYTAAADPILY